MKMLFLLFCSMFMGILLPTVKAAQAASSARHEIILTRKEANPLPRSGDNLTVRIYKEGNTLYLHREIVSTQCVLYIMSPTKGVTFQTTLPMGIEDIFMQIPQMNKGDIVKVVCEHVTYEGTIE